MPRPKGSRNKGKPMIIVGNPQSETFSEDAAEVIKKKVLVIHNTSGVKSPDIKSVPVITREWCKKCQCGHDLVDGKCTR